MGSTACTESCIGPWAVHTYIACILLYGETQYRGSFRNVFSRGGGEGGGQQRNTVELSVYNQGPPSKYFLPKFLLSVLSSVLHTRYVGRE